jgi:hypothetical protein
LKQIQKSKFSRHAVRRTTDSLEAPPKLFSCLKFQIELNYPGEREMTNEVKSSISEPQAAPLAPDGQGAGWLKVGAIAAASAVLGGLAAAWFYRKTLTRLREAENEISDFVPETIEDGKEDF